MDDVVREPGEVWAAPVGAPFPHLHPSRLEGWAKIGKLTSFSFSELLEFTDETNSDGTVGS